MTTDVNPDAIAHSGDLFAAARDRAFKAADQVLGVLQGVGGMGGTDRAGHKWRTDYDNLVGGEAIGQGLASSMQASINSLGRVSELLRVTAVNHHNADTQSQIGSKPPPVPAPHAAADISLAVPPSAEGGDSGEPAWWHTIVSYLQGWTWPNGHQDQLRRASDAWREAGRGFRDAKSGLVGDAGSVGAIAPLMDQRSPEMNAVVATCNKTANALSTVASGCDVAADMCASFAKAIDEAHSKIEHEMVVLGATVVVTEVVAAILIPLTLGASEAVSKGVDVVRLTATAQRIIEILRAFAAAAEASSLPAVAGAANAARFLGPELAEILSARATVFGMEGIGAADRVATEAAARTGLSTRGKTIPASDVFPGAKDYGNLTKEEWERRYRLPDGKIDYPNENLATKPYAKPGTTNDMTSADLNEMSGKTLDRIGHPGGGYLSPQGTSYEQRALPAGSLERDYHAYTVHPEKGLPPGWKIEKSTVGETFGQPGGGIQYRILEPDGNGGYITGNVAELEKRGFLAEN